MNVRLTKKAIDKREGVFLLDKGIDIIKPDADYDVPEGDLLIEQKIADGTLELCEGKGNVKITNTPAPTPTGKVK